MTSSSFPTHIGNYQLDRQIGQGAHATVWLAHHQHLPDHHVAIKLLASEHSALSERFAREAAILRRCPHPQLPHFYDFGVAGDFHYLIMQYVTGTSLRQLLMEKQHFTLRQALTIATSLATIIDALHHEHVIHRDINPNNILIAQPSGTVFLLDFGVAYQPELDFTHAKYVRVGTPGYMAPEQKSAYTLPTHLVDIFSFGVVVFEMIAGQRPWPDQASKEVPDISKVASQGIPVDLDLVFARLLAHDPSQRYKSASAAVAELEEFLEPHLAETILDGEMPSRPARTVDHPVETALALDLDHAVLHECTQHQLTQQDGKTIAHLLNQWGQQSPLRSQLLGRQAEIVETRSYNLYQYEVRLTQETRYPPQYVRVSALDEHFSVDEEPLTTDYWSITLPPSTLTNTSMAGSAVVPGSRVCQPCINCTQGRITCETCGGSGRQPHTEASRSAGICANCHGEGHRICRECAGTGEVRMQQVMQWQRRHITLANQDHTTLAEQHWLEQHSPGRIIYQSSASAEPRSEWLLVPQLAQLCQDAQPYHDNDHHVVHREVVIRAIPVTEFVFDIGQHLAWRWPWERTPRQQDPLYHRWAVIGFANRLPPNQQWWNWPIIWLLISVGFCTILLLALLR